MAEIAVEAAPAEAGDGRCLSITEDCSCVNLSRHGLVMKPKEFLRSIDRAKVVSAIRAAEGRTNGQIRVFVTRHRPPDTMKAAQRAFARLKMARTHRRNSVLIFLAPETQSLAILGDIAVHEKCGEDFWQEVVEAMTTHLRRGEFTGAIVTGVQKAGAVLGEHFPRQPGDRNELPDNIVED